jgi:hypothetical protein
MIECLSGRLSINKTDESREIYDANLDMDPESNWRIFSA